MERLLLLWWRMGQKATVKRFFKENGHYRLQPENDTMDPIIVNEVEIVGKDDRTAAFHALDNIKAF